MAINFDTGNALLEKDSTKISKKNLKYFHNFQISEKNLKGLKKKDLNKHRKLLKQFNIKKEFISLETLNLNFKEIEKNIKLFKLITKLNYQI